jgi:carbamate kinase
MRVVVALGGNALLRRGQAITVENQRENVRVAANALAPLTDRHEVVISHGNGPQVGLLALQAEEYRSLKPYPLDVLGAESEGMIGYLIEQELRCLLPGRSLATILTMVEVDALDPAFRSPTKPIGPIYDEGEAERIRAEGRFPLGRDGQHWRRVVPSPTPRRVLEIDAIEWLLQKRVVVICAGGGGIPTVRDEDGRIEGVEAVIDKDRASALLASELSADLLILATDVDAVYADFTAPNSRPLRRVTPSELSAMTFDAGSMGPKVEAACRFANESATRRAAIGALADVEALLQGSGGTQIALLTSSG